MAVAEDGANGNETDSPALPPTEIALHSTL